MKRVYQRINSPVTGDCFKCCLCSLLELDYDEVPNFSELYGSGDWFVEAYNFLARKGYEYSADSLWNPNVPFLENPTESCFADKKIDREHSLLALKPEDGIDGLFLAGVYSPKYTNPNEHPMNHLHAVLCDEHFNIVFDPQKDYEGILHYPYANIIGFNGIRVIDTLRRIK